MEAVYKRGWNRAQVHLEAICIFTAGAVVCNEASGATRQGTGQSSIKIMKNEVNFGILATLKAKPGKETEVEQFLRSALPLANREAETVLWFALRLDQSTFGIFDAFANESGREAHLSGAIASALMAKWKDLLAEPPDIKKVEILEAKPEEF